MISEEKLFGNYFDDVHITTTCFSNFAADTHNRLIAEDKADQFKPLRGSLEGTSATLAQKCLCPMFRLV